MTTQKTIVVDYDDPYAKQSILKAVENILPEWRILDSLTTGIVPALQWSSYEKIDFDMVHEQPRTSQACSYIYRKALIRKHYLHNTVQHYLAKKPDSILKRTIPQTWAFELDYVDYFDEAMSELYDLQAILEENVEHDINKRVYFILKPSMTDRGQGIAIFSTIDQLRRLFEQMEEQEKDDEDMDGDNEDPNANGIITSQLRHFVIQRYIDSPLLIQRNGQATKFHIRTYVLAVGSLAVYVYKDMLALFASRPYNRPNAATPLTGDDEDLMAHLSNTCLQTENSADNVHEFWSLEGELLKNGKKLTNSDLKTIFESICQTTGDIFAAAAVTQNIHFQTLPNAFEIFGLDFIVNENLDVYLLEINSYPDFKQTGKDLQNLILRLFESVLWVAILPFHDHKKDREYDSKAAPKNDNMVQCLDLTTAAWR